MNRFVLDESKASHVDAWVKRTAHKILEEVPELAERPSLPRDIEAAIREHWVCFLGQLTQPQMEFALVPAAVQVALGSAQTSLPLDTLNRMYRIAQQSTWSYTTEIIAGVDDARSERTDLLIFLWERASDWIDRSINETSRVYHEARRRIEIGQNARWMETVSRILAGEVLDSRWLSSELGGYPMSGYHTAFVLAAGDKQDAVESLEELGRHLAAHAGLRAPLMVRPGGRQTWMWGCTHRELSREVAQALAALPWEDSRVVVGPSRPGVAGFASSHRQARKTLDVVHPDKHGVFLYAEHEALVLLGCNEEVDDFVRRTLRDLAGPSAYEAGLRETVGRYLVSGGSIDRTARELSVHRNTIRYRLQRASSLLGEDLALTSSEVALALRHLELSHDGDLSP